jgi:hypothetical protein
MEHILLFENWFNIRLIFSLFSFHKRRNNRMCVCVCVSVTEGVTGSEYCDCYCSYCYCQCYGCCYCYCQCYCTLIVTVSITVNDTVTVLPLIFLICFSQMMTVSSQFRQTAVSQTMTVSSQFRADTAVTSKRLEYSNVYSIIRRIHNKFKTSVHKWRPW